MDPVDSVDGLLMNLPVFCFVGELSTIHVITGPSSSYLLLLFNLTVTLRRTLSIDDFVATGSELMFIHTMIGGYVGNAFRCLANDVRRVNGGDGGRLT